jgi:hypothetical protein
MECEKVLVPLIEPDNFSQFDCRTLPIENVKYILGPSTYYEYQIGDRTVTLFGELHLPITRSQLVPEMTSQNTLIFSSYVHSLAVQNPDKTYDLMFESIFFPSKGEKKPSIFDYVGSSSPAANSIVFEFFRCIFEVYREKCPYANLRLHYIDFRNNKDIEAVVSKMDYMIGEFYTTSPDNLKIFLDGAGKELLSLLDDPKIRKQFDAIKNDFLRQKLRDYFASNFSSLSEWVMESVNTGKMSEGFELYTAIISQILDIYALARIFRDFEKSRSVTQFGGTAKNVIYYAGDDHIQNLKGFFSELGIKPVKSVVMPSYEYAYVKIRD